MPRNAPAGLLILLVVVTAAVASYLIPETATVELRSRPQVPVDETVIVGPPRVKLAVLVIFDQMRGDYIAKWKPYFPPGGFNRLMDDGCWFSECYYPYATTTTGPGHAAIMTGTTQDYTGIINNEWYDRTAGQMIYCATSDRYENISSGTVPPISRTAKPHNITRKPGAGGAPTKLIAPSIGDNLKSAGRGSKVIGVSIKDRSAMFPSGHYADAAYWFNGEFISSTYYLDSLPLWVRQFNDSKFANQWFGKIWDRYRPDLDYTAIAGPDNGPNEANRSGLGTTFPHPVTGGEATAKGKYYEALITSPYGSELLLEFAKAAIDAEQLGQRDAADLLTISFSSNDLIGHTFGPDSQEVFDMTLRSDRIMANMLTYLDEHVGAGQYAVIVTGDHGICPLPASSRAKGIPAEYVESGKLISGLEAYLEKKHGKPVGAKTVVPDKNEAKGKSNKWVESYPIPWVYLNYRQIETRNLNRNAVIEASAEWLRKQPNIYRVYTAKQIEEQPPRDSVDRLVKASYHTERSGDLYILPKPYYCYGSEKAGGTMHCSPFEYDRHVPLVVYGPYLPKGQQTEPVAPQQAAVIFADYLGLKPPRDAVFSLPKSLGR